VQGGQGVVERGQHGEPGGEAGANDARRHPGSDRSLTADRSLLPSAATGPA
jgi:hypothetical protein